MDAISNGREHRLSGPAKITMMWVDESPRSGLWMVRNIERMDQPGLVAGKADPFMSITCFTGLMDRPKSDIMQMVNRKASTGLWVAKVTELVRQRQSTTMRLGNGKANTGVLMAMN